MMCFISKATPTSNIDGWRCKPEALAITCFITMQLHIINAWEVITVALVMQTCKHTCSWHPTQK